MALVSFLARSKPKIPCLGLSLLRNLTETIATQANKPLNLIERKSGTDSTRKWVTCAFPTLVKMAAGMGNLRRLPVVVILGSTGTGKSKLAIEIGKRFGGEILSADSMQVYKGLDILTNKVSAEELLECPHHLIDFVSPLKEFSVVEFRNMALPLIDDIKKRGKIPILAGGTNYYIESVLWEMLIDDECNQPDGTSAGSSSSSEDESEGPRIAIKRRKDIQILEGASSVQVISEKRMCSEGKRSSRSDQMSGNDEPIGQICKSRGYEPSLYERLREVDPVMADRLHPRDSRKIARSLQVYKQHGKQHSQLLREQQQKKGGSAYGGPLRYDDICVFWLQCERDVLNKRLDERVDEMLERGLINELLNFHREYNSVLEEKETTVKYTEGIFQSIGLRDFHEFLVKQEGKMFDETNASDKDKALLSLCVESMKSTTRRYAKKQMTWVKNRFLARPQSSAPDVYGLDVTDLENWESNVLKNALDILDKLIEEEKPLYEPLLRVVVTDDRHARYVCETCDNRVILGKENWSRHVRSKKHKWHLKRELRNRKSNLDVA